LWHQDGAPNFLPDTRFIYIADLEFSDGRKAVKIGVSKDPKKRVKGGKNTKAFGYAKRVKLIREFPTPAGMSPKIEAAVKFAFQSHRLPLQANATEIFKLSKKSRLIACVQACIKDPADIGRICWSYEAFGVLNSPNEKLKLAERRLPPWHSVNSRVRLVGKLEDKLVSRGCWRGLYSPWLVGGLADTVLVQETFTEIFISYNVYFFLDCLGGPVSAWRRDLFPIFPENIFIPSDEFDIELFFRQNLRWKGSYERWQVKVTERYAKGSFDRHDTIISSVCGQPVDDEVQAAMLEGLTTRVNDADYDFWRRFDIVW